VTRMDSVRAATDTAKESVQHAAEAVAPYAGTAKEQAALYAHEARVRLAPTVSKAAQQARVQYGVRVAPHVPPKIDLATQKAAARTRVAAKQAAEYAAPRVEQARSSAQPMAMQAAARSAAALAALRGQVSVGEIQKLVRKHERRAKAGRIAKGIAVLGMVAGGAFAVWKWWDKQANPDWLVEPPAATELSDRDPLTSVDGSAGAHTDVEREQKDKDDRSS
jgi:hypothetical protein